jgi:hypothetical protein
LPQKANSALEMAMPGLLPLQIHDVAVMVQRLKFTARHREAGLDDLSGAASLI